MKKGFLGVRGWAKEPPSPLSLSLSLSRARMCVQLILHT